MRIHHLLMRALSEKGEEGGAKRMLVGAVCKGSHIYPSSTDYVETDSNCRPCFIAC